MSARERALVVGGSLAGLSAARVLSDHFAEVIVVEKDELPEGVENRKGVPQGHHVHGALAFGMQVNEQLFPGFREELRQLGATPVDFVRDVAWWSVAGWRARAASDIESLLFTRPLFEHVVRRRALAIANVELRRDGVSGYTTSPDRKRVTGVSLAAGEPIEADLVVDAAGRGSGAAKWIAGLGYEAPSTMEVRGYMGYASRLVHAPADAFPEESRLIVNFPYPGAPRGGGIAPQQNDLYMLWAIGMIKEYPPTDEEEFIAFLGDAGTPLVQEVARRCEPVSKIHSYHAPGNYWKRWDLLPERPRGLIVTGDAAAAYNPIYGQGMSVAAYGAKILDDLLPALDDLDELPERFQADLAEVIEWAFGTASAVDAAFPGAELVDAQAPPPEVYEYMGALEALATVDPEVGALLQYSFGNMAPERLYADDVKSKVAAWAESGRPIPSSDPAHPPAPLEDHVEVVAPAG